MANKLTRKKNLGPARVKYAYTLADEEKTLEGAIDRLTEVGNNCGKIKVMRILGQPFAVQIMIGQKQSAECEIFQLFGQHDNK
jgi:hypothetical protein